MQLTNHKHYEKMIFLSKADYGFKRLNETLFMLRAAFHWCLTFQSSFSQRFLECSKVFCWIWTNLNCLYLFLQPLYTDIVDPAYMPLIHTRTDKNQTYAELNSRQVKSGTTGRLQESGYVEPVAIMKYENSIEMKTYTNT